VRTDRQRIDNLALRTDQAILHSLQLQRAALSSQEHRLAALHPLAVLQRGYAVVTRSNGQIVRSVAQVQPGDPLIIQVSDGKFGVHAAHPDEEES